MKKHSLIRSVTAGVLLSLLLLSIPVLFTSSEEILASRPTGPALIFDGLKFQVDTQGNIQAFVDIRLQGLQTANGATFRITYNESYLQPSDYNTNSVLVTSQAEKNSSFFQYNQTLLSNGNNPYNESYPLYNSSLTYSALDTDAKIIDMALLLDSNAGKWTGEGYSVIYPGEANYPSYIPADASVNLSKNGTLFRSNRGNAYCFFALPNKTASVSLGTLSFRVNPDKIHEMVAFFQGRGSTDGIITINTTSDNLITFSALPDYWSIFYYNAGVSTSATPSKPSITGSATPASTWFEFNFEKTMIKAEALQQNVQINAYQAFTDGKYGDVEHLLQKYSPIVVVTYADGSQDNVIFDWDDNVTVSGTDYVPHYAVTKGGSAVNTGNYTAQGGLYTASQYYYHVFTDGVNTTVMQYPKKIEVAIDVTPITVTGVTADKLHMGIEITHANMDLYKSFSSLDLPREARIVTDIYPGAVSMVVSAPSWTNDYGTDMNQLKPIGNSEPDAKWPTAADVGNSLTNAITKGVGTYEFESVSPITALNITTAYPWLTVAEDDEFELYATRVLGGVDSYFDPLLYAVSSATTVTYPGTSTNDGLSLDINVSRLASLGNVNITSMDAGTTFKLYLPNGKLINNTWFEGGNKDNDYAEILVEETDPTGLRYYKIHLKPGYSFDITTGEAGAHRAEREEVRRAINLGGWFYVSITEGRNESDLVPFYVQPRDNNYEENADYNFTGLITGLFPYFNQVPERVTVPEGYYLPESTTAGTIEDMKRYEIMTTYDGMFGAQPGYTRTFEVEKWDKTQDTLNGYDIFGSNKYSNGAEITAYGTLNNKDNYTAKMTFETDEQQAAVTEQIEIYPHDPSSAASLNPDGKTVHTANFNTRKVGYTSRQVFELEIKNTGTVDIHGLYIDTQRDFDGAGSIYLQSNYQIIDPPASFLPVGETTTFTIVYDYDLNPIVNDQSYLNKIYVGSNRHQVVDNVAATGQSGYLAEFDAKFRVTGETVGRISVVILPRISETGDNDVEVADGWVSIGETDDNGIMPSEIVSGNLSYGTVTTSGNYVMDYSLGSMAQEEGRPVFVCVEPKDEYSIKRVLSQYQAYYYDNNNLKQVLVYYSGGSGASAGTGVGLAEVEEGMFVFYMAMVNYDVTIYIELEETDNAKLRFEQLKLYAGKTTADLPDSGGMNGPMDAPAVGYEPTAEVSLFQKVYTDAEKAAAGTNGDQLAVRGSSGTEGFIYNPDCNQYLAVIPNDAEYVGLDAIIREVQWLVNPATTGLTPAYNNFNDNITVSLIATVYTNKTFTSSAALTLTPSSAATTGTTLHLSNFFAAPLPGASIYVKISLSNGLGTFRYYYIEIVRDPGRIIGTVDYGNSPFGIIMNQKDSDYSGTLVADGTTLSGRKAAKQHFINNGYRFDLDAASALYGLTPQVALPGEATVSGLTNTYHREAWVALDEGYDPETAVGLDEYSSEADGYSTTDGDFVLAENNLDLNEYVIFATIGESFDDTGLLGAMDSSMREVLDKKVSRWLEVITQDATGTDLSEKFEGVNTSTATDFWSYIAAYRTGRTAVIPLGTLDQPIAADWAEKGYAVTGTDADGYPVYSTATAAANISIRPGVYRLVYRFLDYDGVTPIRIERLFVVLSKPGDVDADGKYNNTDVNYIHNRVTQPLGYKASYYTIKYSGSIYRDSSIYKYRIADTNNDRNINNIDANMVRNKASDIVTYYPSTGYIGT